ncbi:MAG TPA: FHA domain-containing protein, partial [Xanthomonadaceae bacterium]|nr:FHA domain-containing protein [Xanthomonadaceae bacterium]
MQARLIAYPSDQAAMVRTLEPGVPLAVGRAAEAGLRLDHPSVSRAHAELRFDGAHWELRCLGSKNGSFVDGIRVPQA